MHRDLKTAPRVRLLFDWLASGLKDYVKGRPAGAKALTGDDAVA
jgi:hypothetical protein